MKTSSVCKNGLLICALVLSLQTENKPANAAANTSDVVVNNGRFKPYSDCSRKKAGKDEVFGCKYRIKCGQVAFKNSKESSVPLASPKSEVVLEIEYSENYSTDNLAQFGQDICGANFGEGSVLLSVAGITDGTYFETFTAGKMCTKLEPCKYKIICQNVPVAIAPGYTPLGKPGISLAVKLEFTEGMSRADIVAFGNEVCKNNFGVDSSASSVLAKTNGDEP